MPGQIFIHEAGTNSETEIKFKLKDFSGSTFS